MVQVMVRLQRHLPLFKSLNLIFLLLKKCAYITENLLSELSDIS